MTQTKAVQKKDDASVTEFVPYGSSDKIKLSVEIVKALIAVPTKSGKVCSTRDALKFIAMCQAKRLNPFEGDAFLVGYDKKNSDVAEFSLITAHQAFLKRAELHPEYDGMQSGVIVADSDGKLSDIEGDFYPQEVTVVGGWAKVFHKTRKYPTTRRIRLERFNNGYAQWAVDAAGMIVKCAEADALRSSFPTMLGGMFLRDEIQIDIGPAIKSIENRKALAPSMEPVDDIPMGTNSAEPSNNNISSEKESTPASSPAATGERKATELQGHLSEALADKNVPAEKCIDFLHAKGLIVDRGAFQSILDVPDSVIEKLQTTRGLWPELVSKFGVKEVAK